MGRTALLIGGGGATGALIAHGLAERGYEVTILHRGVHEPVEIAGFPHVHADPHFAETVTEALGQASFDVVVAAYGRVKALAQVFSGRCSRFIAVGGIPIYAGYLDPGSVRPRGMRLLSRETDPLADAGGMQPGGAAGFAAKMIEAEQAVMGEHARGGYAASIFRYPIVYGPRAISPSEWSIVRRVRDGRPFILAPNEGLGIITRCAAVNCAHAVLLSVDCPAAYGVTFNLADDDQYSLGQWIEMTLEILGSDIPVVGLPKALNWAASHLIPLSGTTSDHAMVDATLARTLLGYADVIGAKAALARTIEWRLANPPEEADTRAWSDPFDYALEDQVHARLTAFEAECAAVARVAPAVHPYPHPKAPGLTADHRGR
jgi:nucleoside-diphosphate-sugar epimerase